MVYGFLANMWIMGRVDEVYLQNQVDRGRITQAEYEMIVSTPQGGLNSVPTETI